MASLLKSTTDSPSTGAISPGRLLFVAAATVLVAAAASLFVYEGRASARGAEVNIVPSSSVVNICPAVVSRPSVVLKARGVPAACPASHYKWGVTGGSIEGTGAEVVWDFTGINVDYSKERGEPTSKNFYHATLTVEGGEGCGERRTVLFPTRVVAWDCAPSVNQGDHPTPRTDLTKRTSDAQCPNISLCCHAAGPDLLMPVSATLSGGTPGVTPSFSWTLDGKPMLGQATASTTVNVKGSEGKTVVATLEVGGYGPRCSASCVYKIPECEGADCNPCKGADCHPCKGADCNPCKPGGKFVLVRIRRIPCPGGKCKPRLATHRPTKPRPARYKRVWVPDNNCPKASST